MASFSRPGPPVPKVLVSVLIVLVLGLPAASAATFERAEVLLGPERFEAGLFGEKFEGDDALWVRSHIDGEYGDGDGNVTQDEVDGFIAESRAELDRQLRMGKNFGIMDKIQLNERPPHQVRVSEIHFSENVLGSVDDDSAINRDILAVMEFVGTTRDRANITFAQDFRAAFAGQLEWGHATFNASAPWAIDLDTVEPAAVREQFWTGERFEVPYDETDEFADDFDPLTFQIHNTSAQQEDADDKKDSPAAGIVPWLLVLAIWVALGRRKR